MRRINLGLTVAVSTLIFGSAFGMRGSLARSDGHRLVERASRLSADQMIDRAERLCPRIAPGTQFNYYEASYNTIYNNRHQPLNIWSVECSKTNRPDAPAQPEIALRWNADSGRVTFVNLSRGSIPSAPFTQSAQQAARSGVWWLRELDVIDSDPAWHVVGPIERNDSSWVVHVEKPGHRASVAVYGDSGALQSAQSWY